MDKILQVPTGVLLERAQSSSDSGLELRPPVPPDFNVGTAARGRFELAIFCPFEGGGQRVHAGSNIKFGGEEGGPPITFFTLHAN